MRRHLSFAEKRGAKQGRISKKAKPQFHDFNMNCARVVALARAQNCFLNSLRNADAMHGDILGQGWEYGTYLPEKGDIAGIL